ncbi:MAG: HAD family phosphatase [Syntrophomonadaceae bacterium]|jgi:Cof subfamily protein (haloacid dehalogenase superfamily)|nr:HAD family phosphatase [Syntrophomonadaceae bacterium]
MDIKLVAIDLDDTLLDSGLQVSPKCIDAIRRVQEKGIIVTLATGRMFTSALPYARQLESKKDIPIITYQGALVKCSDSGKVLYYRSLPADMAVEILRYFKKSKVHFQTYFNDQLCMERLTEEGIEYSRLAGVEPVIMENLIDEAAHLETCKILAVIENEKFLLEMELELKDIYTRQLYITRSKPYYLEVMHPQANKGDALKVIADHYHIERKEIMAIGDSYNDMAMIEWAGIGVAMGNAHKSVKETADYITSSNEEEGVAEALHRFILETAK